MESKLKNEKLLLVLLLIFLLIIVPMLLYIFFVSDFRVQSFQNTIEVNLAGNFQYQSGSVCYGNMLQCEEVTVDLDGSVDTNTIGEYYVTYTYRYQEESLVKKQVVKVVDKNAPQLQVQLADDNYYYYCPNGLIPEYDVSAMDEYDGDLTSKIVKEVIEDKLRFSVTDSSGNTTSVDKEAKKEDKELPKITLNGESEITIDLNDPYEELGATAVDNCEGDLTEKIKINGTVDSTKVDKYELEYVVADSSGNVAKITRTVTVKNENKIVTPAGKSIYLTFDDGPGPYTARLLDILKKHNVKATFFVTDQGSSGQYDDMIFRAYKEGHTIGLHTKTHDYSYVYASVDNYFEDLYAIQAKVKKITGYTSTIIRFPGGSSNAVSKKYDGGIKIMTQLTEMVEEKGFRYFDWNVLSGDAGGTTDKDEVVANVIKGLTSRKTNVVLQHDVKSYSVDAVEEIIEYGKANGYTFRAITMSTPKMEHALNN